MVELPQITSTPPCRRRGPYVFGAFVALLLAFLWYVGLIGGNVREVQAGRFYRSAQLSGPSLEGALRKYRIKSVVNLRGSSKKDFYSSEVAVCRDLGVDHFDVSMSAYRLPRPRELQALLTTLDRAPRPRWCTVSRERIARDWLQRSTRTSTKASLSIAPNEISLRGAMDTFPSSARGASSASSISIGRLPTDRIFELGLPKPIRPSTTGRPSGSKTSGSKTQTGMG